jgi:CRISPR-associated protein Cas5h
MFAFEIWGKFASFRDPFTISQNISFPIPPKTTVAGMMASVLGVEEYFEDSAFSSFQYSVVVINPIRKKSFSQNYINDYTSKVQTQLNNLKKSDFEKIGKGFRDTKNPQKPINRELILNPKYLVFIKNFKYEKKIASYLQEKKSRFPFYLGNSEFAGNFKWIALSESKEKRFETATVDSFILEEDVKCIDFQEGMRYSKVSFATKLNANRTPVEFENIIFGSSSIATKDMMLYEIKSHSKVYHCRFI